MVMDSYIHATSLEKCYRLPHFLEKKLCLGGGRSKVTNRFFNGIVDPNHNKSQDMCCHNLTPRVLIQKKIFK